ncbi:hypothetical protein JZ751_000376 [Albula glossodonta]|uniref:Fork-head domain-containing protein n=1 Tax=Albula glossodonta TaxID=121402 RepID=A0A8T2PW78_9TELE|nr:hypothetical protein JZ751_000376 [Albula glossodonta]
MVMLHASFPQPSYITDADRWMALPRLQVHKNSIRHNLSLHSRFVRVQNEGTGKSSWWMLNPGGGKMGKTVRRRGISIDNGTKWWKSKGRGGGKRVCGGAGLHKSPEHSSPKTQGAIGGDGKGFDAWGDLHSHTSSSDSAFGGHLSPIPAEKQDSEDKVQSHPTSPGLHPTSPSAHPPALDLPQLSDLTGAISQEEGYPQPLQTLQPPHQKVSNFSFSPASERLGSYSGSVYSQPGDTIRQPHIPLHTIQENPDHIHGTVQLYSGSETSTLQSLLTSGLQDPAKDLRLGQDGPRHSLIARSSIGVRSHTDHPRHNLNHHLNHNRSHSLNLGRSHIPSDSHSPSHHLDHNPNRSHNLSLDHSSSCDHSHRQEQALSPRLSAELFPTYSLKAHAFYSSSSKLHNLLPASTTQPSNPSSMVSCHLATAPQPWHQPYTIHHQEQEHYFHTQSTGYYSYHAYHYPSHSHKEFPADSNSEFNLGNMDRGAESMFFNDVMSPDETGFSFHSSWPQGRGLGLGGFPAPPHAHTAQSWVPG